MKITAIKKEGERPLLLVVAVTSATGSIFFTVTPAAYADDLTEEDLLSLQDPAQAKVTICHIPPGNPANAHEITVGESAVAHHIAHGDTIGKCRILKNP